jgi:tetratricopeptide (TPR) repeat protein
MVGYARANLAAADEAGVASGAAWARFNLGFTPLWAGNLDEARDLLSRALHEGSRMGDLTLVSMARTYLMVLSRRLGDGRAVERSIDPVIASADAVSFPEYEAMALANRSWVHVREGRTALAEKDARAALELWRGLPVRYPFDWMAAWPLIEVELGRRRIAEAIALMQDMFAEHQQPISAEIRSQLSRVIELWEEGDLDRVERELRRAILVGHPRPSRASGIHPSRPSGVSPRLSPAIPLPPSTPTLSPSPKRRRTLVAPVALAVGLVVLPASWP